jgi:regulator of protease activity HflC (stomatin/prohibitin superfamily)
MALPTESLSAILGGGISSIFAIFKSFRFVHEGERCVKVQFGKVVRNANNEPRILEPGFVFLIPFAQSIRSHHVRQQSYRFPEQHITLADGLIYRICGMVIFKVEDVYKALFEIESIDHSIDDLCMSAIRDELQKMKHDELSDLDKVSQKLIERVKARANEWGIKIIQFSLPECAPTPETANLLNAALGVKLRLTALKKGLEEQQMSLKTVNPNFAAVLVGIPLTATVAASPVQANHPTQTVEESATAQE